MKSNCALFTSRYAILGLFLMFLVQTALKENGQNGYLFYLVGRKEKNSRKIRF